MESLKGGSIIIFNLNFFLRADLSYGIWKRHYHVRQAAFTYRDMITDPEMTVESGRGWEVTFSPWQEGDCVRRAVAKRVQSSRWMLLVWDMCSEFHGISRMDLQGNVLKERCSSRGSWGREFLDCRVLKKRCGCTGAGGTPSGLVCREGSERASRTVERSRSCRRPSGLFRLHSGSRTTATNT